MFDAVWLQRLAGRAGTPPVRPRVDLRLRVRDVERRIGAIEPAVARALAGAGVPVREAASAWRLDADDPAEVDPLLAAAAAALRDLSISGPWRGELLAVHDDAARPVASDGATTAPGPGAQAAALGRGSLVGAIERAAVRPLGIATHAVHLVVQREGGGVWVQQRALDKATDPGLWDTTMGGLVTAGESAAGALERETWEEAGLRLDAMPRLEAYGGFVVRRPVTHGYMVERTELYAAVAAPAAQPVNQDGEVARFECLGTDALVERLRADAFTLEATLALVAWLRCGPASRPTP